MSRILPVTASTMVDRRTQWTWSDRGAVADCDATTGTDTWGNLWGTSTSGYEVNQWTLSPGTCSKWSDYTYPADGSKDKPHTWSYFKKDSVKGTWDKSSQNKTAPFYPSLDGSGKFNSVPDTFDDHSFFVNFPDDKDTNFKDSNRTDAKNLILSFLDLTPVKSTGAAGWNVNNYWTKLPMHAVYGKTGLTANVTGNTNPYTNPPPQLTPLADSLSWANMYFTDYIKNYQSPGCDTKGDIASQNTMDGIPCRGNYVILLTDGLESARLKAGVPDYDAAAGEAKSLLDINVKTFVIGFGQDIVGNQTLNNIAKAGGTDKAYFAANLAQLKQALQVIFQVISNQFYGRSNPVITRTRDRLFRASFEIKSGDYWGHLMAWNADAMTGSPRPGI